MITRVRQTGIVMRDVEDAVFFYEDLGFAAWKRDFESGTFLKQHVSISAARIETAKLKAKCGLMDGLLQYNSHQPKKEIELHSSNELGSIHIALKVASIGKALQGIQSSERSLVKSPCIGPSRGHVKVGVL